MGEELVFYTNPRTRGRIVRWMLEEVGQPYRTQLLAVGPGLKGAAYRAINPMGKVPAIAHRGVIVTETAAICTYLADAFPEAQLAPAAGDPRRGPFYRWLFFAAGPIEAAVTNKALGFETPPGKEVMAGWGTFAMVMDAMESALSPGPYILGECFSAADVYFGSQIGFGLMFNSIEKRPAFERYWQAISSRPAATRARQIDDALIAAPGA